MVIIEVFESRPYTISAYINKVIMRNNINDIIVTTSHFHKGDIAVLYNKRCGEDASPILIVNSDYGEIRENLELNLPSIIIDCGISLKSSVTASSLSDGGINYCIQRGFQTLNKKVIPPQEFRALEFSAEENDIFALLACITVLLLVDIPIDEIKGYKF